MAQNDKTHIRRKGLMKVAFSKLKGAVSGISYDDRCGDKLSKLLLSFAFFFSSSSFNKAKLNDYIDLLICLIWRSLNNKKLIQINLLICISFLLLWYFIINPLELCCFGYGYIKFYPFPSFRQIPQEILSMLASTLIR